VELLQWLSDHLLGWLGPPSRWESYTHWVTWRYLLLGLRLTVEIALFTAVLSLAFGLILALLRGSPYRWLSWPAALYVECGRAVPALLIVLFTFLAAPRLHVALSAVEAAIVGLTIYNAAIIWRSSSARASTRFSAV
jgi:His/Glu/Gln/Arg/opine family amino acid ABC transporter permease subunit